MPSNGTNVYAERMIAAWTHQHQNPHTRSQTTWGEFYDDNPTQITACLGGRAILQYAAAHPDEVELIWLREMVWGTWPAPGVTARARQSLAGVWHRPDPDGPRVRVRPNDFARWLFRLTETRANLMFSGSATDGGHRKMIRAITKIDPDPAAPEETADTARRAETEAMFKALQAALAQYRRLNVAPPARVVNWVSGPVTASGWVTFHGAADTFAQEYATLCATTPTPVLAAAG